MKRGKRWKPALTKSIEIGRSVMLHDFENAMHAGEFEDLLNGRLGREQTHGAFAAARSFMQRHQGAEAAAIDEGGLGQVNIDVFLAVLKAGPHPITKGIGICSAKFLNLADEHGIFVYFHLHIDPPLV
jgi:hypothetical protein